MTVNRKKWICLQLYEGGFHFFLMSRERERGNEKAR
ncbi:hypothetical protein J2S17_004037 [Cytobacillus purgationiresistens]|uniref:Uncharacterized protein n=1 Tax=Cytobacillus purgationiresistens TaxID=863449 RepID=A0ABU0AM63_9BACI|nr:hypothetical protein [Cytobacillus purgationiresistens]